MGVSTVKVTAKKINRREDSIRRITFAIIILLLFLFLMFIFLMFVYKGGRFFISLDPNFSIETGLYMFENLETKDAKARLYARDVDFMDNISINWLPANIDSMAEGSHNGENYLAHTFYIENRGERTVNYWYELHIEDVIRNVDEAIRFMVIINGQKTVYAKINSVTEEEEPGTKAFYSTEIPIVEERKDMKTGDIDKITLVIWLEGDDPDCLDHLIGGEIKANMRITEGHMVQNEE